MGCTTVLKGYGSSRKTGRTNHLRNYDIVHGYSFLRVLDGFMRCGCGFVTRAVSTRGRRATSW